ncbi:BAG domain-containing protein Samui [Musca vetustissima]|uniref:BAG domain-containing protein Samui n=1 Tax=Musca vetustissima TaxID=27455 RepID=UPI002AB7BBB8|nr:BAG domain-containing protein Samui [Musca vetustissima]
MKPTVIANANASASAGPGGNGATNGGITIPINHEYHGPPPAAATQSQPQQYHTQAQHFVGGDPQATAYGSPSSRQQIPQQQQIPAHFQQDFDFDPHVDMDMFPRSRLGRMAHDPFADFGASHFGFPQFNSLGRRRVQNPHHDEDFFNRLPSEFRQYIPEGFGHRRATTAGMAPTTVHPQQVPPQQQHPQQQQPQMPPQQQQQMPPHYYQPMTPPTPSKTVCDAAIQTEDPNAGRSEVDHAVNTDHLNQHGLRNTMDMGVKSAAENEPAGARSHSAPPNEPPQQQQHIYHPQQQQQIPVNGQRQTPPMQQPQPQMRHPQFGTQTSPPVQKAYYAPQAQAHPQQKQQTPPPQTPGGTYIRTIPIFVEGRAEPIINNREIPNQNATPSSASARAYTPPKQQYQPQSPFQFPQPQAQTQGAQQQRPTPINTQQQPQQQQQGQQNTGLPPQTPHTVDSINKIQDIQRDVLELMTRVEKFTGTRSDKEYAYLDEMLTRNLLKLDNIDTNGKESIRLARKEAIKCIQASINVLEAKAEENTKAAENKNGSESAEAPQKSSSGNKVTKESSQTKVEAQQPDEPVDANKIQEPIPLPPPEGMVVENKTETPAEANVTKSEEESKESTAPAGKSTEQAKEEAKDADAATPAAAETK